MSACLFELELECLEAERVANFDSLAEAVSDNKNELENSQRELRKHSDTSEEAWKALFFRKENTNPVAEKLLGMIGEKLEPENTCGVWRFDAERAAQLERPYRKGLTPFGKEG